MFPFRVDAFSEQNHKKKKKKKKKKKNDKSCPE